MSFKQPPELHELQSDVLGESLVDNPYLPPSPIPSKNKVLNTAKPFVTGAINELLQTITNIRNLVETSLGQQQAVLGDFIAQPELIANLQKVESSVLKAILKLYKEMVGDINYPADISGIAPSIKEAIIKLNELIGRPPTLLDWRAGKHYHSNEIVVLNHVIYRCMAEHTSSSEFAVDNEYWQAVYTACGTLAWAAGKVFYMNDIVAFSGRLYRCIEQHQAVDFMMELAYWENLNTGNIANWQPGKAYQLYDVIYHNGHMMRCAVPHTAKVFAAEANNWEVIVGSTAVLRDWQAHTQYALSEAVVVNSVIYRCILAHTSSNVFAGDRAHWQVLSVDGGIGAWMVGRIFYVNDVVMYDGCFYRCREQHQAVDFAADSGYWEVLLKSSIPDWQSGSSYHLYDVVYRDKQVLRCWQPHVAQSFAAEAEHWEILLQQGGGLDEWQTNAYYAAGQVVVVDYVLYRCLADHVSSAAFSVDMVAGREKWQAIIRNDWCTKKQAAAYAIALS